MNAQLQPRRKAVKVKVRRESASHQHYATFSLELLLNDDNTVRRTKATHVQSGVGLTWADWEPVAVIRFVEVNGQLQQALSEGGTGMGPASADSTVRRSDLAIKDSAVKLAILGIRLEDEPGFCQVLQHARPYSIQLELEWGDDKRAHGAKLKYDAIFQAKLLGSDKKMHVGESAGVAVTGEHALIDVQGNSLPPGIYRLSAAVTLRDETARGRASEMVLMQDGGLLNVY